MVAYRFGALARKSQVGRARADAVGVAAQFERAVGFLAQEVGDAAEVVAGVADQHRAAGGEEDRRQWAADRRQGYGFLFEYGFGDEVVARVEGIGAAGDFGAVADPATR